MKFEILKPQSISGKGRRGVQEDSLFPAVGEGTIHDKLFIACDGVGDDGSGYKAAEQFCNTMSDFIFQNTCSDEPFTDELFDEALQECANKMQEKCPDSEGASFAFLYLHRHGCLAAHVGSARIYHIRPKERTVLYRSTDDNRVFSPVADQVVKPVKAFITDVEYGDYFVLLTRGAHSQLSERELMSIVCEPINDSSKMARFSQVLEDCPDNYTLCLVHVSGVMHEALDEHLPSNVRQLMESAAVAQAAIAEEAPIHKAPERKVEERSRRDDEERRQEQRRQEERRQEERRQEQRRQEERRRQHDDDDDDDDDERRGGSGFPVVLITALVMVALAGLAWMWMKKSTHHGDDEVPAVEVKKDSTKKDTINIMKNEKPKPIEVAESETKKEENKQETAKPKQEEKVVEPPTAAPEVAVDEGTTIDEPVQQPTTPAEDIKSVVEPITPTNPEQVTPRPVIPEDE